MAPTSEPEVSEVARDGEYRTTGGGRPAAPSAPPPPGAAHRPSRTTGPERTPAKPTAGTPAPPPAPSPAPLPRPASAGVKAGAADDNLQFNAFLGFLEKNGHQALRHDVSQRVIVSVQDRAGLPLADTEITVSDGKNTLLRRRTYADGRALIFPTEQPGLQNQSATVTARYRGRTRSALLSASRQHRVALRFDHAREPYRQVPLDLAFILDTTGSMGDEIARLKKTLDYINFQISHLTPAPDVRFGMVLFRDKGDDYRTRVIPFTTDVGAFRAQLNHVGAGGGGDTPEDVQEALHQTMTALKWRAAGTKLAFLIGDAPPHLDYGQGYTYLRAMQEAAERGIKIATIGASGLNLQGEVVWRQLAQYTMAPFVFLTRGEHGDSEGSASSVSHHVGSNWVAENLDAIIIRMVKVELGHYSPSGSAPREDYFSASYSDTQKPDAVMADLFYQSVRQLVDYSVQRITPRTPTVVLPVQPASPRLARLAKQLETRLAVGLGYSQEFQLIESRDLSAVIKTQSAQLSEKYDSARAVKLGQLLPAKLAVISRVERSGGGQIEMLIKLVRLETGEILSLSLLKIESRLL